MFVFTLNFINLWDHIDLCSKEAFLFKVLLFTTRKEGRKRWKGGKNRERRKGKGEKGEERYCRRVEKPQLTKQ